MKQGICHICGDDDLYRPNSKTCKGCKRLKMDIAAANTRIVSAKKVIRERKDQLEMRRKNGTVEIVKGGAK